MKDIDKEGIGFKMLQEVGEMGFWSVNLNSYLTFLLPSESIALDR